MAGLYPPIEPFDHGLLEVGDGQQLYWEQCGNPEGKPALVLHGGPGSGCTPGQRRYFDPGAYRVVLFDQRGCGRSRPHASEPGADLSTNTTWHLVEDLERLRERLAIERWLVFGGSWGSVLALVYAQCHPRRVSQLVLTGVTAGRRAEVELLTRGLGGIFPEAWARFRDAVPPGERDGDLPAAYHRLLMSGDAVVEEAAARAWCEWEEAMLPTSPHNPRYDDPAFRLGFARIVTHYWSNGHWIDEWPVIEQAGRLAGIPGVMVQGSLDLGNLLGTAWELHRAWPGSELVVVPQAGHASDAPGIVAALVEATDSHR